MEAGLNPFENEKKTHHEQTIKPKKAGRNDVSRERIRIINESRGRDGNFALRERVGLWLNFFVYWNIITPREQPKYHGLCSISIIST